MENTALKLIALNNALEAVNKNQKTDWKISICGKEFKISCLADSRNYKDLNLFLLGAFKLSTLKTKNYERIF